MNCHEAPKKMKGSARTKTLRAIRDGLLVRPNICSSCGADWQDPHAHHDDYSKPLDVVWLCAACHGQRHKEIRASLPKPEPKPRAITRICLVDSLQPGESFFVPGISPCGLSSSTAKGRAIGRTFTSKTVVENGVKGTRCRRVI